MILLDREKHFLLKSNEECVTYSTQLATRCDQTVDSCWKKYYSREIRTCIQCWENIFEVPPQERSAGCVVRIGVDKKQKARIRRCRQISTSLRTSDYARVFHFFSRMRNVFKSHTSSRRCQSITAKFVQCEANTRGKSHSFAKWEAVSHVMEVCKNSVLRNTVTQSMTGCKTAQGCFVNRNVYMFFKWLSCVALQHDVWK